MKPPPNSLLKMFDKTIPIKHPNWFDEPSQYLNTPRDVLQNYHLHENL